MAETKGYIEKEIVNGNVEYFSATTDLWTSAAGYITFTCHFINQHWELKSYCLQLQMHYLPQDRNAQRASN